MNFIDLHSECDKLKNNFNSQRITELSNNLPKVSLFAIGGFPIIQKDNGYTWCSQDLTINSLSDNIKSALGLSGILTYTNKSKMSLHDLGCLCLEKKHLWGMHWINLSFIFAKFPLDVELAFARDTRFRISWAIQKGFGEVFAATGGIKEWLDYTDHYNDNSFDINTRSAMKEIHDNLLEILK